MKSEPPPGPVMRPRFFRSPSELRAWFEAHGGSERELWIGYYKKGSGRRSVTYPEAVDEALCAGWIDGQVRRVDESSYSNRYTPRRPGSRWSRTNVRRARQLLREGRMLPAGIRAFRARGPDRTDPNERSARAVPALDPDGRHRLAAVPAARRFFEAQPPGYRRVMVRWVLAARRPETRARRLDAILTASRAGRRLDPLRPYEAGRPPRRRPSGGTGRARETS